MGGGGVGVLIQGYPTDHWWMSVRKAVIASEIRIVLKKIFGKMSAQNFVTLENYLIFLSFSKGKICLCFRKSNNNA